ncbi:MAG: patatin-like phospholipase family protein [Opitutales bacterium]
MPNPYRVLSLDGGGSWALIQVRALQELYGPNATGHQVLQRFDLVAANSGGSIVAATLAADWPLSKTLGFFLSEAARTSIFVELPLLERLENCVLGLGPRYSAPAKLTGLAALLGADAGVTLDQWPARVAANTGKPVNFLITGFDYDRQRAAFFRSNAASRAAALGGGPAPQLAEAVHASSNAPVNYFDQPAVFHSPAFAGKRYWDGAMSGLNNPVLAGVVEALANQDPAAPRPIEALSLGTASVQLPLSSGPAQTAPLYQVPASSGLIHDLKETATTILDDPPDEASFIAHVALGQPLPNPGDALPVSGSVVRMSPLVQPLFDAAGNPQMPVLAAPAAAPTMSAAEVFAALVGLEMDAIEDEQVQLIQSLCEAWIAGNIYNQPIRTGANFSCEIGHRWFADAKAAWLARAP